MEQFILLGHLGRDPELRHTGTGKTVCNYSVAVNRYMGAGNDTKTMWYEVTTWGQQAENDAKFLTKGRQIHIVGRVAAESYTDKQGNARASLVVTPIPGGVTYCDQRGGGAEAPRQQSAPAQSTPEDNFSDDEIPW